MRIQNILNENITKFFNINNTFNNFSKMLKISNNEGWNKINLFYVYID